MTKHEHCMTVGEIAQKPEDNANARPEDKDRPQPKTIQDVIARLRYSYYLDRFASRHDSGYDVWEDYNPINALGSIALAIASLKIDREMVIDQHWRKNLRLVGKLAAAGSYIDTWTDESGSGRQLLDSDTSVSLRPSEAPRIEMRCIPVENGEGRWHVDLYLSFGDFNFVLGATVDFDGELKDPADEPAALRDKKSFVTIRGARFTGDVNAFVAEVDSVEWNWQT